MAWFLGNLLAAVCPQPLYQKWLHFRYPMRRPLKKSFADRYIYRGQDGADVVARLLQQGRPCLVTRFGWNEIHTVMEYLHNCRRQKFVYDQDYVRMMHEVAGFFPPTEEALSRFASESLELLPEIDILGVTGQRGDEFLLQTYNRRIIPVAIQCIGDEIAFQERPWTRLLRGRKVLVIHPFAETIKQQYCKRESLFRNPEVLPDFELSTYPALLSNGNAARKLPYANWFLALEAMCQDISRLDFDLALIGAGAYGMFLGAHCKRMGKQALHLGGATQLLFGIKGERWEHHYPPDFSARLFNEHWVRPAETEKPDGVKKVENACYW